MVEDKRPQNAVKPNDIKTSQAECAEHTEGDEWVVQGVFGVKGGTEFGPLEEHYDLRKER